MGCTIFLRKFWRLVHDSDNNFNVSQQKASQESYKTLHKTIKKVQLKLKDIHSIHSF